MYERTLVLSLYGYVLLQSLGLIFEIPNEINFYLRVFIILMYSYVLISNRINFKFKRIQIFLLIFILIYSFRFFSDILIKDISVSLYEDSYTLIFYAGNILFPSLVIISIKRRINFDLLIELIIKSLILINTLIIISFALDDSNISQLFISRFEIRDILGDKTILNPIVVSSIGAQLALIFILKSFISFRPYYLIFIVFGLTNLLLGASRGPAIVFVLLLFLILTIMPRRRKNSLIIYYSRYFIAFPLILFLFVYFVGFLNNSYDIFLFDRILTLFEITTGNNSPIEEVRYYQFNCAINDFYNSPLFGNSFLTSCEFFYPHNIILEILMALGLIGISLFAIIFKQIFSIITKMIKSQNPTFRLLSIIFSFIILQSLTSGSLFFNISLWIVFCLIIKHLDKKFIINQPLKK